MKHELHFSRFEFKYVLPLEQRHELESELGYFMALDPHVSKRRHQKYFVRSLYFDDDGMLRRMLLVQEVPGASLRMTQSFEWRPVAEGRDVCIAASQHSDTQAETPMGPMKVPGETTFTYVTVGEIVLPRTISTTQTVPGRGPVTQTIDASNLKVNGQPAGA